MCRLLAFASPAPRTAVDALDAEEVDAFADLSTLHRHGWGAAWVAEQGTAVVTLRDTAPPAEDDDWDVTLRTQRTRAMGVHLRLDPTHTGLPPLDNHPFTRDGIALLHNGDISPRERLDGLLDPALLESLASDTDSERYLALVAGERRPEGDLGDAVLAAARRLRSGFPTASLNAVVLDTTTLVVVHASAQAPHPGEELWPETDPADLPPEHDGCFYRMYTRTADDGTVAFVSSGIPTDGWEPVPHESVTTVELATGRTTLRRLGS